MEFKYMPKDKWPNENEHITYDVVYRATKHTVNLTYEDFIPSNIENENAMDTFKKFQKSDYSVSLFTDLEVLKSKTSFSKKYNSYSKGFTSNKRGISTRESESKHVNYYLYDYIENSPCDDFSVIEVIDNEE